MAEYFEWIPPDESLSSIEFSPSSDFTLRSFTGTGNNLLTAQTKKLPFEIGRQFINNRIDMRTIVIELRLKANTLSKINELKDELFNKFQQEPAFLEDKDIGLLRYFRDNKETLEIEAVPIDSPAFSNVTRRGNVVDVDIEFLAPRSFWRKTQEEEFSFTSTAVDGFFEPTLEFPFEFLSGDVNETITVNSDVPVPVKIEISGIIENFIIVANNTTDEKLEILTSLVTDETVEIKTDFGEKTVYLIDDITGDRENIIDRVNLVFRDFWQLQPGDNDISVRFGSVENGQIKFTWRERRVGV